MKERIKSMLESSDIEMFTLGMRTAMSLPEEECVSLIGEDHLSSGIKNGNSLIIVKCALPPKTIFYREGYDVGICSWIVLTCVRMSRIPVEFKLFTKVKL